MLRTSKPVRPRRKFLSAIAATALALGLVAISTQNTSAGERPASYRNAVSNSFTGTFADPAVVKAKDGYWYAYSTGDPVLHREGDYSFHKLPIARSEDMVHWQYVGDVFGKRNSPSWVPTDDTYYWGPDVRYLNGQYYMYYNIAHFGKEFYTAVGVATAPTPYGPWTDSGAPVVEAKGTTPTVATDVAEFTAQDGTHYLYWGSFREKGIMAAKLTPDGKRLASPPTRVSRTGEGAYVVRHGEYNYLFFSDSTCCSGEMSGYTVLVGRSKNPLGPFVDREGVSLMDLRYGGTVSLAANGNRWVGSGHNAVATDLAGETWMLYHAIDKSDPYLPPPRQGTNKRPMLLDRLDWIDGWPVVRAGRGPSEGDQPSPVTEWSVGGNFNQADPLDDWRREGAGRGGWQVEHERQALGYIHQRAPAAKAGYLVGADEALADIRAEADLRLGQQAEGAAGLVAAYQDEGNHVVAWLSARRHALITDVLVDGHSVGRKRTALPAGFDFGDWHNVALEMRGQGLSVEVTDARLGDPVALQERTIPGTAAGSGSVGVATINARIDADNIGAAPLNDPVSEMAPTPEVGVVDPAYSDEFDDGTVPGSTSNSPWSWVRGQDPHTTEKQHSLLWPTEAKNLVPGDNTASLLLRDAPKGNYTVETRLTLPLRPKTMRGHQQAGIVVYAGDDENARLAPALFEPLYVPSTSTRLVKTLFSKQKDGGFGWMPAGTPHDTTWLRVSHRLDPANGEHEFRAAMSVDGDDWVWSGTWTIPQGTQPRIGLLSIGGSGATAEFAYFHVYTS